MLGRVSEMTKAKAQSRVADIVRPITIASVNRIRRCAYFINDVFLVVLVTASASPESKKEGN